MGRTGRGGVVYDPVHHISGDPQTSVRRQDPYLMDSGSVSGDKQKSGGNALSSGVGGKEGRVRMVCRFLDREGIDVVSERGTCY